MQDAPCKKIDSALDRLQEAHFWIHMMEEYYHVADPFRWHLNAFLKAFKEIPGLLQTAMQDQKNLKAWFCAQCNQLGCAPLIAALSKKRDRVVHRGILIPQRDYWNH